MKRAAEVGTAQPLTHRRAAELLDARAGPDMSVSRARWLADSGRRGIPVQTAAPPTAPTTETEREAAVTSTDETGQVTGTKDKNYNLIWFTEACLSNALRLETYIQDAERDDDTELAEFFRRAQGESRKGAEQAKQLLRSRL
jgi:hypothetical protein